MSNSEAASSPTVRLVPEAIDAGFCTINEPALTIVPPVKLLVPWRITVPGPFAVSDSPAPVIPPEINSLLPAAGLTTTLLAISMAADIV